MLFLIENILNILNSLTAQAPLLFLKVLKPVLVCEGHIHPLGYVEGLDILAPNQNYCKSIFYSHMKARNLVKEGRSNILFLIPVQLQPFIFSGEVTMLL